MPKWLEIFLEVAAVLIVGILFITFCTPFGDTITATLQSWLGSIKDMVAGII